MFCQNMVKYIMVKYIIKPSSFRFASKAFDKDNQTIIRETLDQNRPQSVDEWNELRDKLFNLKGNSVTMVNIDRIILGNLTPTQLDVGKSYMKYLKESGCEPKTGVKLLLLKLYYKASKAGIQITNSDQQNIIDMLVVLLK